MAQLLVSCFPIFHGIHLFMFINCDVHCNFNMLTCLLSLHLLIIPCPLPPSILFIITKIVLMVRRRYRLARAPLEIWHRNIQQLAWNFWISCRSNTNLMACGYRLKCSPIAHIKNESEKFHLLCQK